MYVGVYVWVRGWVGAATRSDQIEYSRSLDTRSVKSTRNLGTKVRAGIPIPSLGGGRRGVKNTSMSENHHAEPWHPSLGGEQKPAFSKIENAPERLQQSIDLCRTATLID